MQKNNIKKIEKKVEKYIKKKYPQGILIKEYGRVNLESRPDYAIFLPEKIIFIELKGNRDTFARLERQIHFYKRLADELIIVLDKKHNRQKAIELHKKKGLGFISYKNKNLNKKYEKARYEPFLVTDILKLLYGEELKLFLKDIENKELRCNTINDRYLAIKAIYTQFEIKELAHNIIYNRFKKWKENEYPSMYGYGFLSKELKHINNKKEMFLDFVHTNGVVIKNKVSFFT